MLVLATDIMLPLLAPWGCPYILYPYSLQQLTSTIHPPVVVYMLLYILFSSNRECEWATFSDILFGLLLDILSGDTHWHMPIVFPAIPLLGLT
jgi:hypothetical protein